MNLSPPWTLILGITLTFLLPEQDSSHSFCFYAFICIFEKTPMGKSQLKPLLHNDSYETATPYVDVHEGRYLDMVTEADPQGGASGQVHVIVPQRVADALDQDDTQIMIEEDALGRRVPERPPPERLETRKVEFTAIVMGMGSVKRIEYSMRLCTCASRRLFLFYWKTETFFFCMS